MERKSAIAEETLTYYTGRPCVNGHMALRYTGSGSCSQCIAENNRQLLGLRKKLCEGTEEIKLILQPSQYQAMQWMITAYFVEAGRKRDDLNKWPPKPMRRISHDTYQIKVRIPIGFAERAWEALAVIRGNKYQALRDFDWDLERKQRGIPDWPAGVPQPRPTLK